ncbi:DEAD/DEAH box helicase [Dyadobacter fanqingshengii]|uniref:DEAD/DEAH box helicase n=1 Tax=Dyadobacter fanqingshengii TaxID=2906443 RepID=A0A9X1PFT3_9BACT|nr:DEAD/DEAH box helicase [Dyadobacter fanqingshengii]MCF0043304.1 DEAD/DEAH box helicase [Dyadobacter fanqingshengii]USJ35777.1 DEAD/DEAH box helicase [Dyadobacter fanqingshengii]
MSFESLGLSEPLLKTIAEQNYTQPYPIQQEAIPAILKGNDVLGIAKTGSGKTASFVLPILELFQNKPAAANRHISALILVPTRELAVQIAVVFQTFGERLPRKVKTLAVYGGVSINPQMISLQGVEILVATPGRLIDLLSHKALNISETQILVLDEADKMLNLGFAEEMKDIFFLLPKKRQSILFSATLGEEIDQINKTQLRNPVRIEIEEEEQNLDLIKQTGYFVDPDRRGPLLRYLIKTQEMKQVLVFVSATRTADNLVEKLNKNGIQAMAMHSKKSQGARTEALNKFKAGKLTVLVATDLVSRGIDIQFLPYVINFELPRSPKDYVHRIGRTGRAEASGEAISLICPEDVHHFTIIQKKMGKRVEMHESYDLELMGY